MSVYARSAQKLTGDLANLPVVVGDVFDAAAVASAMEGKEAAIVCLGGVSVRDKSTLTSGTRNVVDAMVTHGVERLVVVSAAGVGESWKQVSWGVRFLSKTVLRNLFEDHRSQEAIVRASPLRWTILRPAVLKDGPPTGRYRLSNHGKVGDICRADLADALVAQLTDESYVGEAVSIAS